MLISAYHSLSLSPFFGHRLLSLGGGPFWSWSMVNNVLPLGSSAVVSLHLTLLQFLEPIWGENCWVASVAKKYSAAFEVFVITMSWWSSTLTSLERTRFNRNETQNLTAKLQKVLMHWLNLADLTSLSMRQKSEWWGRLGGQRGICPCNLGRSLYTKAFSSIPTADYAKDTTLFYPRCQWK